MYKRQVQGKNRVDANGKTVVLHGVMDTPNRYFNGWRWQQWKADYSEADIQQMCIRDRTEIAHRGGEGLSHAVRMVITKDGKLKSVTLNGRCV